MYGSLPLLSTAIAAPIHPSPVYPYLTGRAKQKFVHSNYSHLGADSALLFNMAKAELFIYGRDSRLKTIIAPLASFTHLHTTIIPHGEKRIPA